MHTLAIPSVQPELGVRASKASPVIIATDGRAQSDGALAIGRLLAGSDDALRLVAVSRPAPVIPEAGMVLDAEFEAFRRSELHRAVVTQMTRKWGKRYPAEVHQGDPASVIAKLAHETNATMIVSGIGRHRVADRMFGDETALRLIRLADTPVLATVERVERAPTRIVVACDFSETSLRAARMAIDLATTNALLFLVHVGPRDSEYLPFESGKRYQEEAADALARMRAELRPPEDMTVESVLLEGDPATELLAFATGVRADLIATGSHGNGFFGRMIVGSVATRVVRLATCSVLTVPIKAAMTDVGIPFRA